MQSSLFFVALCASTMFFTACETMNENYRATYCNFDGAYKKGMNDAREGHNMDERVSYLCTSPETKAAADQGYREGYLTFLKTQPQRVEVDVHHSRDNRDYPNRTSPGSIVPPGYGVTPTLECRFNSDCRSPKNCRDRGDGVRQCL